MTSSGRIFYFFLFFVLFFRARHHLFSMFPTKLNGLSCLVSTVCQGMGKKQNCAFSNSFNPYQCICYISSDTNISIPGHMTVSFLDKYSLLYKIEIKRGKKTKVCESKKKEKKGIVISFNTTLEISHFLFNKFSKVTHNPNSHSLTKASKLA